jgi:hypothetical protein
VCVGQGRVMAWRISQNVLETSLYGNIVKKEDREFFSKRARTYQSSLKIDRPNSLPKVEPQVPKAVSTITHGSSVSPGSGFLLYVRCSPAYYEQNLVSHGFTWNLVLKQAEKTTRDPKEHNTDRAKLEELLSKGREPSKRTSSFNP